MIVAAVIANERGEVLVTKRRPDQPMPDVWEFPGGKVEPGEAPIAALVREIDEELGATLVVERIWDVVFHAYPDFDVYMLVYWGRFAPGATPFAREVAALAWVLPARLREIDLLPADEPLVARIISDIR